MIEPLYLGIDAGSSAIKCIALDGDGRPRGHHVVATGFDFAESAEEAEACALRMAGGDRGKVSFTVSTGYGRRNVVTANRHVTEITCHARGAREWYPEVRTIIDIGGQDTKVIRLTDDGRMHDYRMNAKCAAGTGAFLEATAFRLGISLSELDELALRSTGLTVLNSYCTVFTGTEVIERIRDGERRENICMGLYRSIARRVAEMLSARDGAIGATGGVVAHSRAMVRALEEVFEVEILLPPMPQYAGAFGAALLAMEYAGRERSAKADAARG